MTDNFNLRTFLVENNLTQNSKLIKEGSDYGFDAVMDSITDDFKPGTPEFEQMENAVQDAFHNNQIDTSEFSHDPSAPGRQVRLIAKEIGLGEGVEEAFTPESKLTSVIQQAWAEKDLGRAKQIILSLIEPSRIKSKDQIVDTIRGIGSKPRLDQYLANSLLKFEKLGLTEKVEDKQNTLTVMKEAKLTANEQILVEMVQNAMGIPQQGIPQQTPTYDAPLAEEDIVEEEPLPKYESIEQLMKEIEHGTNKSAHSYKMEQMKKVYEALESKVNSLEESEGAEYIDKAAVKKMRKDIAILRKGEEKLRKEFEKKFSDKSKKTAEKKEESSETLSEGAFDIRSFLTENKLTIAARER